MGEVRSKITGGFHGYLSGGLLSREGAGLSVNLAESLGGWGLVWRGTAAGGGRGSRDGSLPPACRPTVRLGDQAQIFVPWPSGGEVGACRDAAQGAGWKFLDQLPVEVEPVHGFWAGDPALCRAVHQVDLGVTEFLSQECVDVEVGASVDLVDEHVEDDSAVITEEPLIDGVAGNASSLPLIDEVDPVLLPAGALDP